MLKPKRKILRKEIERDQFLESVFSFKSHFETHKQLYIKITVGIFAAILIITFFTRSQASRHNAAEAILSKGMMYVEQGDDQNAMIHLQTVVDEYGSTDAAKTAGYFIGRINYEREDYNLAQPYFESYISGGSNELLIGAASQALVYILLNKGNVEEAIRYQKRAIDKANSKVDAAFASIQLAELYINKGKTNEAETILKNLLADYEDHFQVRKKIDQVFGMLQADK